MDSSSAKSSKAAAAAVVGNFGEISDPYERIRAHQAVAARLPPIEEIRTILDKRVRGVLCTITQGFDQGSDIYPYGSMEDFACDQDGYPILAINSFSIHSQNLLWNTKCSLFVAKDTENGSDIDITMFGDSITALYGEREGLRSTYLRKHPQADFVNFVDTHLIRIEPKFVRYTSTSIGSGKIDFREFKEAQVDPISQFTIPIASHMNRDHAEDTKAIVQSITSVEVDSAYMLDVDRLGFNVKAVYEGHTHIIRIPFPRPARERKDVKTLVIEMLQAARASTSA